MSLLICVPIHGGGITEFWESLNQAQLDMKDAGFDHDLLTMKNESLVTRARDNCVTSFLETGFERLLFIDADIEFTGEDIVKLWNLDVDVAVGAYPMKQMDVPTCGWVDGHLINLEEISGPTEVDFAGTGFMMIKREVFLQFQGAFPERFHREGKPAEQVHSYRKSFCYFYSRLSEGENWKERIRWPEDYAFCHDFRSLGGKIILEPSIKLRHWGLYGYGEDNVQES